MKLLPSAHGILALTLARSPHASIVVRDYSSVKVDVDELSFDATLVMHGPTVIDVAASAEACRTLHAVWDGHLDRETARLAALEPEVLIVDVRCLLTAAVQRLGTALPGSGPKRPGSFRDLFRLLLRRACDTCLLAHDCRE